MIADLTVMFEGLVDVAERFSHDENLDFLQCSLLDIIEFISVNHDALCVKERPRLVPLRKITIRFETLIEKIKSKIDYRVFSIFMENCVGGVSLTPSGPLVSPFNRFKSKLFRASMLSWVERETLIQGLLRNVSAKRHLSMIEGRHEVRGYQDMSDTEIQGWATLAGEMFADDSKSPTKLPKPGVQRI